MCIRDSGGVMEHIEEAGIHSGDSACTLPPATLGSAEIERCLLYTSDAADERSSVDLGGRRIINKKKTHKTTGTQRE